MKINHLTPQKPKKEGVGGGGEEGRIGERGIGGWEGRALGNRNTKGGGRGRRGRGRRRGKNVDGNDNRCGGGEGGKVDGGGGGGGVVFEDEENRAFLALFLAEGGRDIGENLERRVRKWGERKEGKIIEELIDKFFLFCFSLLRKKKTSKWEETPYFFLVIIGGAGGREGELRLWSPVGDD